MAKKVLFYLLLFLATCDPLFSQETRITLFTFGNFNELLTLSSAEGNLATLATLLQEEKKKSDHSLTILTGSILSPHFLARFDQSCSLIDILNTMPIDLALVGCHDFDFGVDLLKKRMQESKFCWLSSNILQMEGSSFVKNETKIYEIDGIKMGIFALTSPLTEQLSKSDARIYFTSALHVAKQKCAEFKKANVDLIIAITDMPLEEDRKLAHKVPQIDLILGGYDREGGTWQENRSVIHKTGSKNTFLTRIDLVIEKKNRFSQKEITLYPSWRYLEHKKEKTHAQILEKIEKYYVSADEKIHEPLATLEKAMDSRFERARTGESTVGNLIADAALSYFSADCALLSAGMMHADRLYPAGMTLTRLDVYREIVLSFPLVLLELSGKDLAEALEASLGSIEKRGSSFPQVAGLSFTFDAHHPVGKRICSIKVGQEPLVETKTYKIVTLDDLARGKDGYASLARGKILSGSEKNISLPNVVIHYIQEKKKLNPSSSGRIVAVNR